ncbi:MAG: flagellar motor switch protein FliG [Peptostreptococcaceae bacterium]|nr:flagellar motor switch protein FliG [Peptostreptococcaceae bacterium]
MNKLTELEELNGVEKAAVLFISLGSEKSSKILKMLPEPMIEKITYGIANITSVEPKVRDSILLEFVEMNKAREHIRQGGIDYARDILTRALGNKRAQNIIDNLSPVAMNKKPFSIARETDPMQVLKTIVNEHPQTIALIMCFLEPENSARILSELPDEVKSDVAYRIATMNKTSPTVIMRVEKILDGKLSNVKDNQFESYGGIKTIVDILNSADRSTEKNIIEEMAKENPKLVEEIKDGMFVFEDIISLDSASIQRMLREIDGADLALSIKGASRDMAEIIYKNLSKRAVEVLKDDVEFLGPVRLVSVEEAQHKIVAVIRRLDEAGEIYMNRGGEDAIIS